MEEMKEVFDKLSDGNKDVLNLVAQGMIVAQEAKKEEEEKENG